jgi:hypothetical protein
VVFAACLGFLPQARDRVSRRRIPQRRPVQAVLQQLVHVQLGCSPIQPIDGPPGHRQRRQLDQRGEEVAGLPADPVVALPDLHDRAAQRGDTDDRVERRRAVPDEEHHRAAGSAKFSPYGQIACQLLPIRSTFEAARPISDPP